MLGKGASPQDCQGVLPPGGALPGPHTAERLRSAAFPVVVVTLQGGWVGDAGDSAVEMRFVQLCEEEGPCGWWEIAQRARFPSGP